MNVLFDARLLHRPLSGLERVQRNLLRELAASKQIDRLRVLVRHGTVLPDSFPARAEAVQVHGTEDILRELLAPDTRPDVYHLSWFPDRNPRDLWLPLAAKASVVEVHDAILNRHPEYHPNHDCWKWYHSFVRTLVRNGGRLLCHSRSVIEEVVRDLGGERSRCDLAPLAVEPTLRVPLSEEEARQRRERLGMPERYFLAVGKDYPHKGHNTMFRAIARLPERIPVVCAGSQVWNGPDATRKQLEELQMTDSVRWVEGLDDEDVKALIQGALALVYPSTEEGFGLPPIEAMALGTPVLAAAAMSIPEVCDDGAWLFPPGNVGALVDLMRRLLNEPERVQKLVERGREVEQRYSWKRCAEATIRCYERAIAESRRGKKGRKRPALPTELVQMLQVQATSPFSADRELAAWQERCLSVENTLNELRMRLNALQPEAPTPAPPPPPPVPDLAAAPETSRPRFSLRRRMRKIRDSLRRRSENS
ncbi:MAG: glycosyltransferase family 4 protein [Planctomycetota bacterium]